MGRSKLRTFDRLEGLIVVPLFAAFIVAVAAAPYFGRWLYHNHLR